jgi:hypothetical protein
VPSNSGGRSGAGRLGQDTGAFHQHSHGIQDLVVIDENYFVHERLHVRECVNTSKWRGESIGDGVELRQPDRFPPGETLPHRVGAGRLDSNDSRFRTHSAYRSGHAREKTAAATSGDDQADIRRILDYLEA